MRNGFSTIHLENVRLRIGIVEEKRRGLEFVVRARDVHLEKISARDDCLFKPPARAVALANDQLATFPEDETESAVRSELEGVEPFTRDEHRVGGVCER